MGVADSFISWIIYYKFEVEAVILVLFGILLICLILKAILGTDRKYKKRMDSKIDDIRSAVDEIKADRDHDTLTPPISISADGREVHISIGSKDETELIKTQAAGPENGPEITAEPVPEAAIEPEPEPVPEVIVEPEPEPVPEVIVEPEPEPVPEVVTEPEPEPVPEVVTEPEPEPVPEVIVEPEPEPAPEVVVEPEPVPERVVEPEPEPAAEPEPEPVLVELEVPDEDEVDLKFESGVEPVVNIFTACTEGLEPGEHVISLQGGETKDFLLAADDLIRVLVPESAVNEPTAEAEAGPGAEQEPFRTIELAFDSPLESTPAFEPVDTEGGEYIPEEAAAKPETFSGRRSTEEVRKAYEASVMRGRGSFRQPLEGVRSFATDKHGNTYTEQSLMDQIR